MHLNMKMVSPAFILFVGVLGVQGSYLCGDDHADTSFTCQPNCKSEWKLVFKAVSGVATSDSSDALLRDPYAVWNRQAPLNEDDPDARRLDAKFRGHYKSSFALNWERRNIREVKVALYDEYGGELMRLVFDGRGTNHLNWFTRDRLLYFPYDDLFIEPNNYFSIAGGTGESYFRRFFINRSYGGCPHDLGWLVVVGDPACPWEGLGTPKPTFLYSLRRGYTNWNTLEAHITPLKCLQTRSFSLLDPYQGLVPGQLDGPLDSMPMGLDAKFCHNFGPTNILHLPPPMYICTCARVVITTITFISTACYWFTSNH